MYSSCLAQNLINFNTGKTNQHGRLVNWIPWWCKIVQTEYVQISFYQVQYFSLELLRLCIGVQIAPSIGILHENAIYCIQVWKRLINPSRNFQAYLEMPAEMSSAEIELREIASFFHTPSSLISFTVIFYLHFYWKFRATRYFVSSQSHTLLINDHTKFYLWLHVNQRNKWFLNYIKTQTLKAIL